MAPTAAVVTEVQDEALFQQELSKPLPGTVVCALFYAEWAAGAFGPKEMASLAAGSEHTHCLSINAGTDEGEELALTLGLGSKLPVVRFYLPPATSHTLELIGADCNPSVIAKHAAALGKKAAGSAAAASGGIRDIVRGAYAQTAVGGSGVLPTELADSEARRKLLGYKEDEVNTAADIGLGCGNPLVTAKLKLGEACLDLGSGAGMDCFIAAKQ
ncbi:unnamed protein product, partial [Polarella glacialis]